MAEEYKSNSHRSKEHQDSHEPMPEKKTEKVVTGNVKQRKKSGLSRASNIFMPGDVDSVKSYILMEVLVPSIKRAISDIVCNGINMLLGEPARNKPGAPGARVAYRQYYQSDDRKDYARPRAQAQYNYDDIVFETRGDAEEVLYRMEELLERFEVVSVADLFDMAGMSQISNLVRTSSLEDLATLFPIGDQIIMPWKDMDDQNHNTDETAYQVAWDIVHHGEVELRDGSIVPGMFIQMHLCSAYGVQFSHQQAFMNCPEGMAAGTYHVTFGATWGSKGADAGTTWQFTLTQAVPAGGRISGFESLPDQVPSAWRIKTWATPASADPIETVTVTSGDGGTDLGTMQYASVGEDGLNSMQATGFGHNRWSTSALRQYLNKSGANWWASQEDFDIRPDQYAKQGFMTGFDAEFLNAIKPVKVTTALNTVEGFEDATEDTFDTFFVPSLQQMNVNPQLANVEGDYFEYWRARLGKTGYVGTGSSNVFDAFKIPALNANSAQIVRLRSAYRSSAHKTLLVSSSGYVANDSASHALYFSPVCVIC